MREKRCFEFYEFYKLSLERGLLICEGEKPTPNLRQNAPKAPP